MNWAPFNICVNALCPGPFKTPMNEPLLKNAEKNKEFIEKMPMGRWGMPKDLQGIALLLSSDACSYITGTGIVIDGGWTVQ
jgi:NAD(P)-dependent dehydrogenase (short-subunit alcohol dehydrogenase family)